MSLTVKILEEKYLHVLENQINRYLSNGWSIQGSISVCYKPKLAEYINVVMMVKDVSSKVISKIF